VRELEGKRFEVVKISQGNESQIVQIVMLSEKEIINYLKVINCPFCRGNNLKREEFYRSLEIVCEDCGFKLSSHNLYVSSRVEEGMETVEDVLRKPIQEAVVRYKKTLEDRIVTLVMQLDETKRKLRLYHESWKK
jgi:hypothetical protein